MVYQNYFIIEVTQFYFIAELGKTICKLIQSKTIKIPLFNHIRQNEIWQTDIKSSWNGRQTHFKGSFCIELEYLLLWCEGGYTYSRGHKISSNIAILWDKTFQKIPRPQWISWRLSIMCPTLGNKRLD